MFIFRWLYRLILLLGALALLFWAAGYIPYQGKPLQQHVMEFLSSPGFDEGVKDLRSLFGQGLQVMGKKIEEGISSEDQKELKEIIQKDLTKVKEHKNPNKPPQKK